MALHTLTFLSKIEVTVTAECNTFRIVDESLDRVVTFLAGDQIKGVNVLYTGTYTYDIELTNGDCIFGLPKNVVEFAYYA